MKRFVERADRGQSTLFPECLDDWIDENNPVRVIDAFVDTLDLSECPTIALPSPTSAPSVALLWPISSGAMSSWMIFISLA
jgi:transposase